MKALFTAHKLKPQERLWLEAAIAMRPFDARTLKIKLHGKVPTSFDDNLIDSRIWRNRQLTLIGRWLMNPHDPIFDDVDRVIRAIRVMILGQPGIDTVGVKEIALKVEFDEMRVARALYHIAYLPGFANGSAGIPNAPDAAASLNLNGDHGYDAYLDYAGLKPTLQAFYQPPSPRRSPRPHAFVEPLHVSGYFVDPEPRQIVKKKTAFLLMAINPDDPLNQDFYSAIKETCAAFGLRAYRADDIQHQGAITERVLEEIASCEFLIADLTGERPNVYYEIGYAHALDKHPILLRREGTKLHFDISVHNAPSYKNATELRSLLSKRLEAMLGRGPRTRKK